MIICELFLNAFSVRSINDNPNYDNLDFWIVIQMTARVLKKCVDWKIPAKISLIEQWFQRDIFDAIHRLL